MEQIYDNPGTAGLLLTAITSSTVTFLVSPAATGTYPGVGNFRIQIDSEIMEVTAAQRLNPGPMPFPMMCFSFTVVRGSENSSAVSHLAGASVSIILSQGSMSGLRQDVNQLGTYTNLPKEGMQAGDRYKCTDSEYEFIYGSSWQAFHNGMPVKVPPVIGTMTTLNGPFTTTDGSRGVIYHMYATNGSYVCRGFYKAQAHTAPPYSVILGYKGIDVGDLGTQNYWGVFIMDTALSNMWFFGQGDSSYEAVTIKFSPSGGYGGANPVTQSNDYWTANQFKWIKFYDDGTNWNFFTSLNRNDWNLVYQFTRTTGFTWVGWGINQDSSATSNMCMEVFDFQEGTS